MLLKPTGSRRGPWRFGGKETEGRVDGMHYRVLVETGMWTSPSSYSFGNLGKCKGAWGGEGAAVGHLCLFLTCKGVQAGTYGAGGQQCLA